MTSHPQRTSSVTLVCWNAYPLFDHSVSAAVGGMETRSGLFGRSLNSIGIWSVRFVVGDFQQDDPIEHEGIRFDRYQGLQRDVAEYARQRFVKRRWFPIINLRSDDLALLWTLPLAFLYSFLPGCLSPIYWHRRRTDIVCCFGNNQVSAEIVSDCQRLGVRTVLCLASDDDLDASYQPGDVTLNDYGTPRWMAHFALENADHIFVQTECQQQLLSERFGRHGEIVRNPVRISPSDPERWPERGARDTIIWIGRSDTFHKRPLLFLELARRCPELPFVMIVNKTDADVFDTLLRDRPDNLTIIEQVPHREIWEHYRQARVFVSTSVYEGFPNTFLQCAVAGVPVASLQGDPEGILAGRGCGLLAEGSMDRLADNVRTLWADQDLAESYSSTFHCYTLKYHSLDSQVAHFDSLLRQAIDTPLRHPPIPWWKAPFQRFARRTGVI